MAAPLLLSWQHSCKVLPQVSTAHLQNIHSTSKHNNTLVEKCCSNHYTTLSHNVMWSVVSKKPKSYSDDKHLVAMWGDLVKFVCILISAEQKLDWFTFHSIQAVIYTERWHFKQQRDIVIFVNSKVQYMFVRWCDSSYLGHLSSWAGTYILLSPSRFTRGITLCLVL